jgi:O-antigen/teichoic acid export membrane protein
MTLATVVKLAAALLLVHSTHTAEHWAYLYAASSVFVTIAAVIAVGWLCARPRFDLNLFVPSVREGVHFATALASQSIYNDIDKTMLARLSSVEAAAIYAVAYRLIEPVIVPIRSVASASYPEFFRMGAQGVTSGFALAKRILRRSMVYGITAAVGLFAVAGLLPLLFGQAYRESTIALRWLCVLPAFKCVHIFLSDTLTGANRQWQTSSAQMAVAVFNVLINLWIIQAFSWRGAAWSSLLTDGLLVALLYLIIRWHLRRERAAVALAQPAFATGR